MKLVVATLATLMAGLNPAAHAAEPAAQPETLVGPGWTTEFVDPPTIGGVYTSIVHDGQGMPYIGYTDYAKDDVKLAHWNGAAWTISTVDAGKNVSTGVDLALDPNGNPTLTYGWGPLKFAAWTGTTWTITTIENSSANNDRTSLAYHNGEPWVSYRKLKGNSAMLKVAHRSGSTWVTEVVDSVGNTGRGNALAFDPSGNPLVAYTGVVNSVGFVKLARKTSSGWSIETVCDPCSPTFPVSMALDSRGWPAIVHNETNGAVMYRWNGSSWDSEVIDSASRPVHQHAIRFDANGMPWVGLLSSGVADLRVAWRDSLGWQSESVETAPDGYGWSGGSLALDPAGNPVLAYTPSPKSPYNWNLKFAHRTP